MQIAIDDFGIPASVSTPTVLPISGSGKSARPTVRQIEPVDPMERDDERYPTTAEGSSAVNRLVLKVCIRR
ncbi:hypothetical protein [Mycobacterium sp.]|uniref:hypothetical protein n=1 Tax=Mycobacterium sp. TaxID=1785 RepID=UPI002612918E|nr:hypothetical protein [Mycobacterium sp.]